MPYSIEEWIAPKGPGGFNEKTLRAKVKETLIEVFREPNKYEEIILDWGIGAGKSFFAGAAVAFMIHRLLCLNDPHAYFGLAKGTPIALMNMSIQGTQAKKVVFGEIKGRIEVAKWFHKWGYEPDPKTQSELRFPKGIEVIPGNSKETFPAGFDLYVGILDEAAWHIVTQEKDNAEESYNTMKNRIKTRFPGMGKLIIISSPKHIHDFLETKMEKERDNPRIYTSRIASWESPPPSLKLSGEMFLFDTEAKRIVGESDLYNHPTQVVNTM